MLAKVKTAAVVGLDAQEVDVEVDIAGLTTETHYDVFSRVIDIFTTAPGEPEALWVTHIEYNVDGTKQDDSGNWISHNIIHQQYKGYDAYVYHDGPLLDVFGADELRLAHCDDQQVGRLGVDDQVPGLNVASGDGSQFVLQEQGDRSPSDGPLADNDCVHAAGVAFDLVQDLHDGQSGAGGVDGCVVEQQADVGGVDALHVLVGVDVVLNSRGVDALRQWQVE